MCVCGCVCVMLSDSFNPAAGPGGAGLPPGWQHMYQWTPPCCALRGCDECIAAHPRSLTEAAWSATFHLRSHCACLGGCGGQVRGSNADSLEAGLEWPPQTSIGKRCWCRAALPHLNTMARL